MNFETRGKEKKRHEALAKHIPVQKIPYYAFSPKISKSHSTPVCHRTHNHQLCSTDSTVISELVSPVSPATATLITGSLNTDSNVLVVVRLVREVRGGGIMLYVVTMSLRLGMTTSFSADATSTNSLGSEVEEAPRLDRRNWPE